MGRLLSTKTKLAKPPGLASLVLASTPANIQQFVTEAYNLMNSLPTEIIEVIQKHEASGTTQDSEYKRAMEVFN
jgi:hypothetical protein